MAKNITLFWFRRDLRLEDNHGFYEALNSSENVLPIFIFDKNILEDLPKNDARVSFLFKRIQWMRKELHKHNKELSVFYEEPIVILKKLIDKHNINNIFTNRDYEPYAKKRDAEIQKICDTNSINFKTFKDQVFFEKDEVVKADGDPYVVYTPYKNKWKENFENTEITHYPSEDLLKNIVHNFEHNNIDNLEAIGFEESTLKIKPYTVTPSLIADYGNTRDFPAKEEGTSKLGPHLRFGTVSNRKMIANAIKQKDETFWSELIWREFFMQILWHFPETRNNAFRAKYDKIEWRNNEEEFECWKEGKTGYPLVDAGMRELNTTGYMHNRVRMLVASFLCKHLLIDWRWGEAYFAEKLMDYEMSSNVGNWQWAAGSGVDAAPYFRIFNPTTQIHKFDKQHEYIRKHVKDLDELTYPNPIVDHKMARERCLRVYKEAVS